MTNNQTILITGHSGFLGQQLSKVLKTTNFHVAPFLDANQNRIDISQGFKLPLSPDIVIHAAGKAHSVPTSPEEEKAFFDVNYQGTINLCNAIDQLTEKPQAFIFVSTVAVYGVDSGEMIAESHPLNGITPYAKSKIQAEQYLTAWAAQNNITLSILRLPLIAGCNPPGNLGAMINGIKTGKYLSIGKANAKKSMVWAEDIGDIIPQLIEKGGVYNLTDGYHPSFGELEKAISGTLGKSLPIKIPLFIAKAIAGIGDLLGSKAPLTTQKLKKITSSLTFDDRKAKTNLKWEPRAVILKTTEMV